MTKYKIKRKKKSIKSLYIALVLLIILILISTSYAIFSSQLTILGAAAGNRDIFDIVYVNIDQISNAPTTIIYHDTYTYTFPSVPTIEQIFMGERELTENTDYTYINGTLTIPTVTGDLSIVGIATEAVYNITYNLDGGEFSETPVSTYTESTETFDLPTPTKTGYNFVGWTEGVVPKEKVIQNSTTMELNVTYNTGTQGNKSIYIRALNGVVYTTYVTITQNNESVPRVMVYTYDDSCTVQFSTDATSWTTINNWVTKTDGDNNTIYYQYFTLSSGGENEEGGISTYEGTETEFFNELSDTDVLYYKPYTVTQGSTGDISVTALWRSRETYTVTFNRNRGSGTMESQTFESGVPQALKANTFTRNRYRFSGWATSANGSVVYSDGETITVTQNMTLYAKWTFSWN